ncbi:MAG: cytochrome c, partial [Pseudomonadota bacterium]|nr:cytochrome c [Pseudomonadota bacterium]
MKRAYQRFAALALLVVSLPVLALLAGEAEDGGPLHDQFCLGCHVSMFGGDGSAIYVRSERR